MKTQQDGNFGWEERRWWVPWVQRKGKDEEE